MISSLNKEDRNRNDLLIKIGCIFLRLSFWNLFRNILKFKMEENVLFSEWVWEMYLIFILVCVEGLFFYYFFIVDII